MKSLRVRVIDTCLNIQWSSIETYVHVLFLNPKGQKFWIKWKSLPKVHELLWQDRTLTIWRRPKFSYYIFANHIAPNWAIIYVYTFQSDSASKQRLKIGAFLLIHYMSFQIHYINSVCWMLPTQHKIDNSVRSYRNNAHVTKVPVLSDETKQFFICFFFSFK